MIGKLKSLLSGENELPEVTALRKAIDANREERKTLLCWYRDTEKDPELEKMYATFARDPRDLELGRKIIERHVSLTVEAVARGRLHQLAWHVVGPSCTERLRAALRPALQAVFEKVESEITRAREHDKANAAEFGIDYAEDSPVVTRLTEAANKAKAALGKVDKANEHELPSLVAVVLGQALS